MSPPDLSPNWLDQHDWVDGGRGSLLPTERGLEGGGLLAPRTRRVVLLVAVVSLLATVTGLLYGARLTEPDARARDSFSRVAIGHRAWFETLDALGHAPSRGHQCDLASAESLVAFIEPDLTSDAACSLLDTLVERESRGRPTLVVVPKWAPAEFEENAVAGVSFDDIDDVLLEVLPAGEPPLVDRIADPAGEEGSAPGLHEASGPLGTFTVALPEVQVFTSPGDATPLLSTGDGDLIVQYGETVLVSDPDLLHNFNIQRADHAVLWATLLADQSSVIVDEVFHGHQEQRSLATAMGRFPAVLIVVHALGLGFLLLAAGTRRFGRPLPPPLPPGRGPGELIAVAASVQVAGRDHGVILEEYAEVLWDDVVDRLGLSDRKRDRDALLAHAAERRGLDHALAVLTRAVRSGPRRAGGAVRLAREAWQLRERFLTVRPLSRPLTHGPPPGGPPETHPMTPLLP